MQLAISVSVMLIVLLAGVVVRTSEPADDGWVYFCPLVVHSAIRAPIMLNDVSWPGQTVTQRVAKWMLSGCFRFHRGVFSVLLFTASFSVRLDQFPSLFPTVIQEPCCTKIVLHWL